MQHSTEKLIQKSTEQCSIVQCWIQVLITSLDTWSLDNKIRKKSNIKHKDFGPSVLLLLLVRLWRSWYGAVQKLWHSFWGWSSFFLLQDKNKKKKNIQTFLKGTTHFFLTLTYWVYYYRTQKKPRPKTEALRRS